MSDTSMCGLLHAAAEEHGLVGTSVLSADELESLPQHHGLPVQGIRGDIEIEGKTVSLSLALRLSAPYCLPFVFLRPWDAFGVIPHVDTDGYVCFAQNEGLILDPNRFEQVVSTALGDAIGQIGAGARKENSRDFIDEFLPYWNRQEGILEALSFVECLHSLVPVGAHSYLCHVDIAVGHADHGKILFRHGLACSCEFCNSAHWRGF